MSKMAHYDFVEIGTSDFATLIGSATEETVGLSVEPVKEYLDRLPNPPNVKKVCAAVSNESGELELYWVPDSLRVAHRLPDWVKGANSVGCPHQIVVRYLKKRGLPLDLIHTTKVPVIRMRDLILDHEVASVDYLKIDTEGHDMRIMQDVVELIKEGWTVMKIKFESNQLADKEALCKITQDLTELGYTCRKTFCDTYATRD